MGKKLPSDAKNCIFVYGYVCQNFCYIPSEVTAGLKKGQRFHASVCVFTRRMLEALCPSVCCGGIDWRVGGGEG